ncbi:L,D-transpeptidase [Mesorhizobium sp. LHD-90]|uniref:L,D-transpeptidase n=1 Tax=Mesorhizobium sp. LHD-90 TaxID=3071414 RepID=UPI0027E0D49C|nr:L,D-transpeptidase [Mesorhizobium sp. LHD-90]MDQ6437700.1 L,D-transpeptidase [Mesorhizobium sp. LHD-90]
MLPRSLILLGLCAVLGLATPAFADVAKPQKPTAAASAKSKTATDAKTKKKVVAKANKKGKKPAAKDGETELTAQQKAKAKAEAKAAAAEKARQARLAAMRAKAKADAEARSAAFRAPRRVLADGETPKKKGKAVEVADTDTRKRNPFEISFGDSEPVALKTKPVTGLTAERIAAQQAASVGADEVLRSGNNGELRSGATGMSRPSSGFFNILFGDEPETATSSVGMLPETRALDSVLDNKKKFKVRPEYEPQSVAFSGYPAGTIVIDTSNHFLYLVESFGSARRYGIAVGREGLQFKGTVAVGDKQEWPRWIPTLDMQKREPKKYGQYKDGMPGGGQNPLGARAIYLYQGKQDTHLRIHGTIAPQTIGTNSSNGCFRMVNDHVMDLYRRVGIGTKVVIL